MAGVDRRFHSLPFVWASLAAAVVPGFGMGAVLFGAVLLKAPIGGWWAAAAQAHGHAQVFGLAGLMVFGVGFHFLPRLRGAPLAAPRLLPRVLALYGGGLLLRVLGQQAAPLLASWTGSVAVAGVLAVALALSGPLELAGVALAIVVLVRTGRRGPPLRSRSGVMQVLPLLVAAWVGLLLALVPNAWGTLAAGYATTAALAALPALPVFSPVVGATGAAAPWLLPAAVDAATVRLALLGWLVPLAVAFAARTFPLFLRTRLASPRRLRGGLVILVGGLAADVLGRFTPGGWAAAEVVGAALEGLALLWFTHAVGALGPKVTLPGRYTAPEEARLAEAMRPALVGAFAWLAVAGALLLLEAAAVWDLWPAPPEDAQRHALGAGFLTLLIVGMALHLLPGFAGARVRDVGRRAAGAAIWLAHAAALLRVAPPVLLWLANASERSVPSWLAQGAVVAETAAGLGGVAAIGFLAAALRIPLWPGRADTA